MQYYKFVVADFWNNEQVSIRIDLVKVVTPN